MNPAEERNKQVRDASRRELEKLGVENVRIALASNINMGGVERIHAWEWLKEKDESRASSSEWYSRWTFIIAIIGTVAAVVAAIASLLALKQ
jgi:hypothetical protein